MFVETQVKIDYWSIHLSHQNIPYLKARYVIFPNRSVQTALISSSPIVWMDLEEGVVQTLKAKYWLGAQLPSNRGNWSARMIRELAPENVPADLLVHHTWDSAGAIAPFHNPLLEAWVTDRWAEKSISPWRDIDAMLKREREKKEEIARREKERAERKLGKKAKKKKDSPQPQKLTKKSRKRRKARQAALKKQGS